MDNDLALLMLGALEELTIENLTLKAILMTQNRNLDTERVDSLVSSARRDPAVRDTVRAQFLPLRQQLESDSSLEEALRKFAEIVPPPKDVN